jgi:hypothetical protein
MVLPHTDNFGRYEGDAELVKATCMPLSTRPVRKFAEAINNIAEAKLWTLYKKKDSGRLVIQYNTEAFDRINQFLIRHRNNPEYPGYEEGDEQVGKPVESKAESERKPEKPEEEKKNYFGFKRVFLTETEYKRLTNEFGEMFIRECIEYLDLWFEEKEGRENKYTSHNACIRRWVTKAVTERKATKGSNNSWQYKVNTPNKRLEECRYCHKLFPNAQTHELNCPKAPALPSSDTVARIIEESKKLTDHFDAKKQKE